MKLRKGSWTALRGWQWQNATNPQYVLLYSEQYLYFTAHQQIQGQDTETLKFMEKKICCTTIVKANHCIALHWFVCLWQWCFYPSCPCWKLHIYFHLFLFLLYLLFAIKIIETVYFALTWKKLEDNMQQRNEYIWAKCCMLANQPERLSLFLVTSSSCTGHSSCTRSMKF